MTRGIIIASEVSLNTLPVFQDACLVKDVGVPMDIDSGKNLG